MRVLSAVFAGLVIASPAFAQQASTAAAGELRVLDKTTGHLDDFVLSPGQSAQVGLLSVTLHECRYPAGNINADAYGKVTITYDTQTQPIFDGWMIASAPALNALDHPRFDVWVLRCKS